MRRNDFNADYGDRAFTTADEAIEAAHDTAVATQHRHQVRKSELTGFWLAQAIR